MDNLKRRVLYARQRFGTYTTDDGKVHPVYSAEDVLGWIKAGTENSYLTPGQLNRVRHGRAGQGRHRRAQRDRRRTQLLRRLAHWGRLNPEPEDPDEPGA